MLIDESDLLLEIYIRGMAVAGENNLYADLKNTNLKRYKRFDFYFNGFRYSTYMEEKGKTPFYYDDGKLYYYSKLLNNINIKRIKAVEWGSEQSWYIKTWNSIEDKPYELRLNPINICSNLRYSTGENGEFKGCAFCHRVYTHGRYAEKRKIKAINEIFDEIFEQEGRGVIKKIRKTLIMTGNMNETSDVLALCSEAYNILLGEGYTGVFSISTNQICDECDIKALAAMDNTIFDYTLEMFERRQCLMGEKKGYDMNQVIQTLKTARQYFKNIRITYVVGLDRIIALKEGFLMLKKMSLIDDLIPLIFVPYTPEMKKLRNEEAMYIDYYKEAREFLKKNDLVPKKNGLSKNLFLEDKLHNNKMDRLLE